VRNRILPQFLLQDCLFLHEANKLASVLHGDLEGLVTGYHLVSPGVILQDGYIIILTIDYPIFQCKQHRNGGLYPMWNHFAEMDMWMAVDWTRYLACVRGRSI